MKHLNQTLNFSLDAPRHSFSKSDLENCAEGLLFGPGNAQLPSGPLLMMDRVVDIQSAGGKYDKGYAIAELDITSDTWFFRHHFADDPIMPGCFLIESMWQLTGFYMAWHGLNGKGRVLDSGRMRFLSPVKTEKTTLTTTISIRKILTHDKRSMCVADSIVTVDGKIVCDGKGLKIGLFL